MANSFISPVAITKEALRVFHNTIQFAKKIDKQYDDKFANSGATMSGKIGPTLSVRMPNRYNVRHGASMVTQDVAEQYKTISCTQQIGVDMQFSSADLTLTIDDFAERYIRPATMRLASEVDAMGTSMFWNVFNQVGIPGTDMGRGTKTTDRIADASSPQGILNAGALLTDYTTPTGARSCIWNPSGQASMVGGLSGLLNSQAKIGEQYDSGEMGTALGFDHSVSQSIQRMTCGSRGATGDVTVKGATESGGTLNVQGTSAHTINAGDVFTIAGVYAVNPETKAVYPYLQQFTVLQTANPSDVFSPTTTYTLSGSGTAVPIPVYPPIVLQGSPKNPAQTVWCGGASTYPNDGAAIVFMGAASASYAVNLAFIKEAFTLVTADLIQPRGVDMYAQETSDGIRMRLVRQYNIATDILPARLDIMMGLAALRPEFAIRVAGA